MSINTSAKHAFDRARSPKGVPTGGQFAAESKVEPSGLLADDSVNATTTNPVADCLIELTDRRTEDTGSIAEAYEAREAQLNSRAAAMRLRQRYPHLDTVPLEYDWDCAAFTPVPDYRDDGSINGLDPFDDAEICRAITQAGKNIAGADEMTFSSRHSDGSEHPGLDSGDEYATFHVDAALSAPISQLPVATTDGGRANTAITNAVTERASNGSPERWQLSWIRKGGGYVLDDEAILVSVRRPDGSPAVQLVDVSDSPEATLAMEQKRKAAYARGDVLDDGTLAVFTREGDD